MQGRTSSLRRKPSRIRAVPLLQVLAGVSLCAISCIELNEPATDGAGGAGGSAGGRSGGGAGSSGTAAGRGCHYAGSVGGSTAGTPAHDAGDSGQGGNGGTPGGAGGETAGGGAAPPDSAGAGGAPATGGTSSPGGAAGDSMGGLGEGGQGGAGGVFEGVAPYDPENPPTELALSGDLGAHDPVIIKAGGTYYVFHTGPGISVKVSSDLRTWSKSDAVFDPYPAWIGEELTDVGDLWAPDISFFGGVYHLYYAASTFGSNHSCIGHATRAALDTGSFVDHGPVICSNHDGAADDWNAIDPNVVIDDDGGVWLSFGSFWGGLKMIRLDENGARSTADTTVYPLAERPAAVGRAVEAPTIVKRGDYYYLFASFDRCCNGTASTYRVVVGRSRNLLGPYVDRVGTPMTNGGGTPIVVGGSRWRGPGHNAVLFEGNEAFNVYHAYDATDVGRPKLRISELAWDAQGWPISAGP